MSRTDTLEFMKSCISIMLGYTQATVPYDGKDGNRAQLEKHLSESIVIFDRIINENSGRAGRVSSGGKKEAETE